MYTINESTARIAHEMRSFSDYQPGSATAEYTAQVNEAEQILETVKAKCSTEAQRDRADYLFDRYAKTLAEAVLSNESFWGEDLTKVAGLTEAVTRDLETIRTEGAYAAMKSVQ